jgi:hypothetical protein
MMCYERNPRAAETELATTTAFAAQYARTRGRNPKSGFSAMYGRARGEQAERRAEGLDYIRWPSAWRAVGACTPP